MDMNSYSYVRPRPVPSVSLSPDPRPRAENECVYVTARVDDKSEKKCSSNGIKCHFTHLDMLKILDIKKTKGEFIFHSIDNCSFKPLWGSKAVNTVQISRSNLWCCRMYSMYVHLCIFTRFESGFGVIDCIRIRFSRGISFRLTN